MNLFQEKLIFQSTTLANDFEFEFNKPFEELNIKNENSLLNLIHFKVKEPKGCILYFHGNAGDLTKWGKIVEPLLQFNYNIIVMDYRGYGKSRGEREEGLMYSDAEAAYNLANEFFNEDSIVVYGRSLGSTFAVWVATKNKPKKVILETPFYSLKSVVESKVPFLPIDYLLEFNFNTSSFIKKVSCPISIFHGKRDGVVPFENGKRLSKMSNDINFTSFPEGKHNNLMSFEKYWNCMSKELY